MSFVEKTGWFLANAASSIAIMISLFFWLFLYQVTLTLDPVDISLKYNAASQYEEGNTYGNTFVHGVNSIRLIFTTTQICYVESLI